MVCGKTLPKSFINAMYKFRAFYNNFRIVDYLLTSPNLSIHYDNSKITTRLVNFLFTIYKIV